MATCQNPVSMRLVGTGVCRGGVRRPPGVVRRGIQGHPKQPQGMCQVCAAWCPRGGGDVPNVLRKDC